jgi:cell wall-associated NlpC family hydrolase
MTLPGISSKIAAWIVLPLLLAMLWMSGCTRYYPAPAKSPAPRISTPPKVAPPPVQSPAPPAPADPIAALLDEVASGREQSTPLEKMGYSTQVGAFANLDYAVRLERLLDARGIDAYYFRHESGLYKVRFGNHASYREARAEAEQLKAKGLINEFFIVIPEDYAAARIGRSGQGDLREELVRTARRFLGVPYRWGGTDQQDGFDCSGLTMVCYRLNGLNLPRISRNQFAAGRQVPQAQLRPGDLVFFATRGGRQVSHVGLYIGHGKFIHAPRTGEQVRIEQLSTPFYDRTFLGGRSYF